MQGTSAQATGLYATVLGTRWNELAEIVRRLHTPGTIVTAVGVFSVRRGNWLTRCLASVIGLPKSADAVEVHLTVTPTGTTEEWRRLFAGKPFVSTQWLDAGRLIEKIGLSESPIEFDVREGALHYQTTGSALRLGFLRVPMPRWLSPRVTAFEKPAGDKLQVFVEVALPMLGRLICYEGTLTSIDIPCPNIDIPSPSASEGQTGPFAGAQAPTGFNADPNRCSRPP
jgi:hypothetical protein